jgi:Lipase (class 3)
MKSIYSTALVVASLVSVAFSAQYDEAIGLKAMYYAGATYCSLPDLMDWQCGAPCYKGVTEFTPIQNEALNTFGFVAYNEDDNEIVVAFRGTQIGTVLNWISDLDYHRV